jgi:outer membrane lipoprotein-sorting protein
LNGDLNYKMMNTIKYSSLLLVLILSGCMLDARAQDAASILAKMDKIIFSPKDKQGKVTIILSDVSGKEKVREAQMMQKGRDKKLYRYTKPESQAGIATLSLSNDVMWLYMPAFGKPKKISMLAKDQSFTGTDFSYEDMVTTPYSDRYTPTLLSSEGNTYLLKLVPKSGKSNYSKVFVKIDKANGYPVSMEFFNRMDKKFKEADYKYEKVGGYWNAAEVTMKDFEKNHTTKILLQDVKFDQGLSDDLFLVENLKPVDTRKENKQPGSNK